MAVKKGFTVASSLVKDDNGFTTGIIVKITQEVITRQTSTKRGEIDEVNNEVNLIPVHCESSGDKLITINLMLGTKINPEPLETVRKGSKNVKIYNKLTTFLIKTGCLQESELNQLAEKSESVYAKFEALEGQKIRFKSEKNKAGFNDISIGTIEIVTESPNPA